MIFFHMYASQLKICSVAPFSDGRPSAMGSPTSGSVSGLSGLAAPSCPALLLGLSGLVSRGFVQAAMMAARDGSAMPAPAEVFRKSRRVTGRPVRASIT